MLEKIINEIRQEFTQEKFNLSMDIFNEDVKFHDKYRSGTEEELCCVLRQSANLVKRLS
ncbi:hypothetical protein [Clostridium septicum]|uniref:Nuclear transport factor 2 family protein n=1 Tax=Clostridium septicum TaxID=1504 RepID=A0ABY5B3S3_CLOSE|nr:hypothetical protein [Clostridium septicum]MDU1313905.1 hypothetical protein [Clostridium septicum]UEC20070.1 hypothetical protein LK444_11725 [Clostridium septicum]USS01874.1 hypothetical protein NH397_05445 [Clostridium septicum]WLF70444.1 hypothetical protein Q6375_05510 [Clostridium septicum]